MKRNHTIYKIYLSLLLAVLMLVVSGVVVQAHDDREILGGKYQLRVGFIEEPTYQGLLNGIELAICQGQCQSKGDGTFTNGVTGAFDTLKAEVTFGSQSITLPLVAVPRNPGRYNARFVPTRTGDYTFRFFGTIGTDPVDEKFISGPNTFDSVQPLTNIQFPDKPGFVAGAPSATGSAATPAPTVVATPATTVAGTNTSQAELQSLKDQLQEQQKQLQEAKNSSGSATLFGIIGVVVGGIGLLLAAWALVSVGRKRDDRKSGRTELG